MRPSTKSPETSQTLVQQILNLASREGKPQGSQLTVAWLAEQLHISRTPVNAALKHLTDMGLVEHRRNRGYFLLESALETEQKVSTANNREDIQLTFAQDALNWGDKSLVSIAKLMKLYAISRTQAQQLVDIASNQGWLKKSAGHNWVVELGIVSDADYSGFYRFRQNIEPAAMREPGFSADLGELERLEKIQRQLSDGDFKKLTAIDLFEINRDFHETIVSWSGNRFYYDALKHSNDLRRLLEYSKVMKTQKIDSFAAEHLGILGAIRSNDLTTAETLMRAHLQTATDTKT